MVCFIEEGTKARATSANTNKLVLPIEIKQPEAVKMHSLPNLFCAPLDHKKEGSFSNLSPSRFKKRSHLVLHLNFSGTCVLH